jgi:hypothetical protein
MLTRTSANLEQAPDAAPAQTIPHARSSVNIPDSESCTKCCALALRRKARISAWQRCPPSPIRRRDETTRFQNPLRSLLHEKAMQLKNVRRKSSKYVIEAAEKKHPNTVLCGNGSPQFTFPAHVFYRT